MKVLILAAILLVLSTLSSEACNTPNDRQLCASINRRCSETKASRPPRISEDALKAINNECRRREGEKWRDLALCDVVRAICELAIIRCQNITCRNIQKLT